MVTSLRIINQQDAFPRTLTSKRHFFFNRAGCEKNMINFIVLGKCRRVTSAVLQAIRSFTDAKCIVIGGPETTVLRWSALCKRQVTIDLSGTDDERFVDLVNDIVKTCPHVILIPVDCDGTRLVNRVRDRLMLPVTPIPEMDVLDMFDNKWTFHQFCTRNELAVPETRFIPAKNELDHDAIAAELGSPFVVKPIGLAGSTGVQIVHSKAEFEEVILNNDAYDYGALIAQQYIDGEDIDVSFLALGGRLAALAIQQVHGASIVFCSNPELEAMAERMCRASEYHGVMHVDARIDAKTGKLYLIESNPRFWASLTASVWCGLNFVAQAIIPAPGAIGVRRLTSGTAYTRFPLIRPGCWQQLISDTGERGRLLRAMSLDPVMLSWFLKDLPATGRNFIAGHASGLFAGMRRTDTPNAFAKDVAHIDRRA